VVEARANVLQLIVPRESAGLLAETIFTAMSITRITSAWLFLLDCARL
jgi:hypothetical protein